MSAAPRLSHLPVMAAEVVAALEPRDGGRYVDGTFGGGGYAEALLKAAACRVWGIDRDPAAIAAGAALAARSGQRLDLVCGRFGEMDRLLAQRGVDAVDGVALDLGLSSIQLDDPARGFSFQADGPLDMRLGEEGESAADVVNHADEATLARILATYGEERFARRIARAIVGRRASAPIRRTAELAEIVRRAVPRAHDGIDPATRTFQALRIYVNDELGELARGLAAAETLLVPGGRLAVVAFHSLEDRLVKEFLVRRSRGPAVSRHRPLPTDAPAPTFRMLDRRPRRPSSAETATNPRARSARLRVAERAAAVAPASAACEEVQR